MMGTTKSVFTMVGGVSKPTYKKVSTLGTDDDSIYGVTLGMNPSGDGSKSLGIGVETMDDKDAPYSNWQFDDNANWNKNSYEVGVSLGRRRLLDLEDQS